MKKNMILIRKYFKQISNIFRTNFGHIPNKFRTYFEQISSIFKAAGMKGRSCPCFLQPKPKFDAAALRTLTSTTSWQITSACRRAAAAARCVSAKTTSATRPSRAPTEDSFLSLSSSFCFSETCASVPTQLLQ